THIQLSGGKNTGEKIGITATLDLTGEDPIEEFIVDFAGIKMNTIELSENPLLSGSISNGSMDVSTSLNIREGSLEGSLKALADGVEFVFPQETTTDRISGIVRNVFRELDKLDLEFGFSGSPDDINISMNSNLDKLLGSGIRSAAGDELMKAQTDLENKVKERIEPEKQRLMAFYNSKLGDLDSKITQLDAITGSNNQLIESKKQELEKRIDSEKNPLLKQALKAVKQIIKW
ncbi:MAG: hypothetical protein GY863_15055, partial [bacterium]|nr:hypothetical protein [bacterium]